MLETKVFLRILSFTFIFISLPFNKSYALPKTVNLTHIASKKQVTVWAQVYSQKHEHTNPPASSVQEPPPSCKKSLYLIQTFTAYDLYFSFYCYMTPHVKILFLLLH